MANYCQVVFQKSWEFVRLTKKGHILINLGQFEGRKCPEENALAVFAKKCTQHQSNIH